MSWVGGSLAMGHTQSVSSKSSFYALQPPLLDLLLPWDTKQIIFLQVHSWALAHAGLHLPLFLCRGNLLFWWWEQRWPGIDSSPRTGPWSGKGRPFQVQTSLHLYFLETIRLRIWWLHVPFVHTLQLALNAWMWYSRLPRSAPRYFPVSTSTDFLPQGSGTHTYMHTHAHTTESPGSTEPLPVPGCSGYSVCACMRVFAALCLASPPL